MSKVTDMMYDLIHKAQTQDKSYISALDAVSDKHCLTAHELFDGNDLAIFLSNLHQEVTNLKAMLHAIDIERDFLQMDGHKGSPRRKSYSCRSNGWTEQRLNKWYSHSPSKVIIATGFIASTPQNIPTTLKRDGSDFSAAIIYGCSIRGACDRC
ncbi:bifunctional aspartokinase/homoserine dehydrogenase chloroplastic-like [Trifolium medium]|uniref:Bifunctional aspartokinase/homoserine dehydrogenase chloroplastic-like n=1 Tax=Trifolium medium TaxID=97028 RepID=A0A392MNA1_9FABA|nr:bifunctional aspartokinase/homoserine dehydrogenase chloroplastic-like [Trifolium medium]